MRVLCLHPETSSAYQFSQELQKLEERLWTKHGIELVFVDGPLLDVQVGTAIGEEGGGINAIESSSSSGGCRCGSVRYLSSLWLRQRSPLPNLLLRAIPSIVRYFDTSSCSFFGMDKIVNYSMV